MFQRFAAPPGVVPALGDVRLRRVLRFERVGEPLGHVGVPLDRRSISDPTASGTIASTMPSTSSGEAVSPLPEEAERHRPVLAEHAEDAREARVPVGVRDARQWRERDGGGRDVLRKRDGSPPRVGR